MDGIQKKRWFDKWKVQDDIILEISLKAMFEFTWIGHPEEREQITKIRLRATKRKKKNVQLLLNFKSTTKMKLQRMWKNGDENTHRLTYRWEHNVRRVNIHLFLLGRAPRLIMKFIRVISIVASSARMPCLTIVHAFIMSSLLSSK